MLRSNFKFKADWEHRLRELLRERFQVILNSLTSIPIKQLTLY